MEFRQHTPRRDALQRICNGFGGVALAGMLQQTGLLAEPTAGGPLRPRAAHIAPRAKRIIFLFMHGGPSHVDLFDPKPRLARDDGKPLPFPATRVTFAARGHLMRSPWKFRPCGRSGLPMSTLWRHLPTVADELCMLHSLCETNVSHGGACMKMHTGDEAQVRPSVGSWISYGLGTENQNLPSFITICPTSLHGGVNNFGPGFLPTSHSGVALGAPGYPNTPARNARFDYMANNRLSRAEQRLQIDLLAELQRARPAAKPSPIRGPSAGINGAELEARIQAFELAFRMQTAAPEAFDIGRESQATQRLYGIDDVVTRTFGEQCLLARRLVERGVRVVQLYHNRSSTASGCQIWDQHSDLKAGLINNCAASDRPISGLLTDLKSRGLLDDTLVIWGGEFGRTPTAEGKNGREHHPFGFSMWLAGGGVRGGRIHGATDEFGWYAQQDKVHVHDLHATILHLMGLDHERLTWRHAGRDYRLTDVHGRVVREILA